MAINIKEIFDGDSSAQQIDKINYNFDQIVANGGGPIGATGAQGEPGSTGAKGAQGAQGPAGPQGAAGDYTDFFVVDDNDPTNNGFNTIYSRSRTGKVPSVILGETNVDENWDPLNPNNSITYADTVLKLKGNQHSGRLLRLDTNNTATSTQVYIDLVLSDDGSDRILQFDSSAIGSPATYLFEGKALKLNYNSSDRIKLDALGSFIDTDIEFKSGRTVEFNGTTRFVDGNQAQDRVLKSDASGNFFWGDGASVPFGTIVMVSDLILDPANNKFTYNTGASPVDGRGKIGTEWEGWYYCNGATWTDGAGTSYTVPDLQDRFPRGVYNSFQGLSYLDSPTGSDLDTISVSLPSHTHSITNTLSEVALDPSSNIFAHTETSQYATTQQTNTPSSTAAVNYNIDIKPKATYVGYVIYLGANNLYATF